MPLQLIQTSESTAAQMLAQHIVHEVMQLTNRIANLRENGVPAVPPHAGQTLPGGHVIAPHPGVLAITPAALDAALGAENCALFDGLKTAIGI